MKKFYERPVWTVLAPLCAAVLLLCIACLFVFFLRPGSRKGQTIVLAVIDTCRWDSLGCYGAPNSVTPVMDEWSKGAVRFEQAVAPSCWTLPSFASILTSTSPTVHGAVGKGLALHRIRAQLPTGPECLAKMGFRTHGIANCAFLSPALGLSRGFGGYDYEGAYSNRIRRADRTVDAALAFLRDHQGENLFLMVHFFDPHLLYDPPSPWLERAAEGYEGPLRSLDTELLDKMKKGTYVPEKEGREFLRRLYEGEISFVDEQYGRLVEGLRSLGLYEDAAVILTADHGEEFWDHGGFEHGHTLYDELVRVPLFIKLPARRPPLRRIVKPQVSLLDIMPTIFELAQAECPPAFSGRSLLPFCFSSNEPEGGAAFSEATLYGRDLMSLREGGFKYIFAPSKGGVGLYHVSKDPGEGRNLIARMPEKAAEMEEKLLEYHTRLLDIAGKFPPPLPVDMTGDLKARLISLGYLKE